jgi:hypothetical protein
VPLHVIFDQFDNYSGLQIRTAESILLKVRSSPLERSQDMPSIDGMSSTPDLLMRSISAAKVARKEPFISIEGKKLYLRMFAHDARL